MILFHVRRQLEKMHCSGPRARSSHPAVPDQTPNRVHALSFHVFLVPALPSASSQLPAAFVFPPGTAFQAFGVGLLNSRLSVLSSGLSTVPSQAQHPWLPALHPCWGCVSQPASCPAVVLCTRALGLLSGFGCAALPVQPQRLLFPQSFIFCTCRSFLRGRFSAFLEVMRSSWWCFVFSWITKLSLPQWYYYYSFLPQCSKSISFLLFLTRHNLCCENLPVSLVPLFPELLVVTRTL